MSDKNNVRNLRQTYEIPWCINSM